MSYLWYWPAGGWDFDAWKKKYPWTPVTGPQTGIAKLNNLLQGIDSRAEWQEKRAEWLVLPSLDVACRPVIDQHHSTDVLFGVNHWNRRAKS